MPSKLRGTVRDAKAADFSSQEATKSGELPQRKGNFAFVKTTAIAAMT
jgi:hypothetical protein